MSRCEINRKKETKHSQMMKEILAKKWKSRRNRRRISMGRGTETATLRVNEERQHGV